MILILKLKEGIDSLTVVRVDIPSKTLHTFVAVQTRPRSAQVPIQHNMSSRTIALIKSVRRDPQRATFVTLIDALLDTCGSTEETLAQKLAKGTAAPLKFWCCGQREVPCLVQLGSIPGLPSQMTG